MTYYKLPDMHNSPKHIVKNLHVIATIEEAAEQSKPEFILIPGDFFDKPFQASSKDEYDQIFRIAKRLQDIAQVYFVTGTPTHDAVGSYEPFKAIGWIELKMNMYVDHGDYRLFGLPEINKNHFMAKLKDLKRSEVNAEINRLIDDYLKTYIGINKTDKSIFVGHGTYRRSGLVQDKKLSGEVFVNLSTLEDLNLTDIALGHIHKPDQYYGGSAINTYGECGYIPSFEIVTDGVKSRHPYGFKAKEKVTVNLNDDLTMLKKYKDNDLWLTIKCTHDESKTIDKDSIKLEFPFVDKITLEVSKEISDRAAILNTAKTYVDKFRAWRPEATIAELEKVSEVEQAMIEAGLVSENKSIDLLSVKVYGSKGSIKGQNKNTFDLDLETLSNEITILSGGNGKGKSFFLGFWSPYNTFIGQKTELKDLFKLKDSYIERVFQINSDIIRQRIEVDPTLKTPSVKYYMFINDKSIPECTGTKAPFVTAVNELFGAESLFLMSVFQTQKTIDNCPKISEAKESSLREIYTELSGTDKDPARRYAEDKRKFFDAKSVELKVKLDAMNLVAGDDNDYESELTEKETMLDNKSMLFESLKISGIDKKNALELLKADNVKNVENKSLRERASDKIDSIKNDIESNNRSIEQLTKTIESEDVIKDRIIAHEANELKHKEINDAIAKSESERSEIVQANRELRNSIIVNENKKQTCNEEIERLERTDYAACEECGHINTTNKKLLDDNEARISELKEIVKSIDTSEDEKTSAEHHRLVGNIDLIMQKLESNLKLTPELNHHDYKNNIQVIGTIEASKETIATCKNNIQTLSIELQAAVKQLSSIPEFDDELSKLIESKDIELEELRDNARSLKSTIEIISNDIKTLKEKLEKKKETESKIKTVESELKEVTQESNEWRNVENAFKPKAIPSIELAAVAPDVDRIANDILKEFYPRYFIETETQDKKTNVERFQIWVYDNESLDRQPIYTLSGGQAAWINNAVRIALKKTRQENTGVNYGWEILDEVDAPLDSDIITEYYRMIEQQNDESKIISITHSTEAKGYIQNHINIEEVTI